MNVTPRTRDDYITFLRGGGIPNYNACQEIVKLLEESPAAPAAPAPQAEIGLSADLAPLWCARVNQARCSIAPTGIDETILAVDALLRQRREPLSEARINSILDASGPADAHEWHQGHFLAFASAIESAIRGTGKAA